MIIFTKNPNLFYFFWGGGVGGARVSEFFTKNQNLKKDFFWWGMGGWREMVLE